MLQQAMPSWGKKISMQLEVQDLTITYGAVRAVRGVSLVVKPSMCVSVVGSNGAGKSSLLRGIAGLVPLDSGHITLEEQNLTLLPAHSRVSRGLALVPEGRNLFPQMSVRDTLILAGAHQRRGKWNINAVLELFPRLADRFKVAAGNLSGGEQQMLAIGRALMLNPSVLMLDEPSAGLAPRLSSDLIYTVSLLVREGLGILLVEQNVHAARLITDHAMVMDNGIIVRQGGRDLLVDDQHLIRSYFGV